MKNKAIFLDRDGTLIYDRPGYYLINPKNLKIYKDTFEALKTLQDIGFKLFIISNQSAIGRGYATETTVKKINKKLTDLLKVKGVKISGISYCPHIPKDNCKCRKPNPLLGRQIIKKYNLKPESCYMIGDKQSDIDFGYNLRLKTILVKTGHGISQIKQCPKLKADFFTKNILTAAKWIKRNEI